MPNGSRGRPEAPYWTQTHLDQTQDVLTKASLGCPSLWSSKLKNWVLPSSPGLRVWGPHSDALLSPHSMKKLSHPSTCRTGLLPSQPRRYSFLFSTPRPGSGSALGAVWFIFPPTPSSPSALPQALSYPSISQPVPPALLPLNPSQSIPAHEGYTQVIANDRGHLLPSVPRSKVRPSPPFSPKPAARGERISCRQSSF